MPAGLAGAEPPSSIDSHETGPDRAFGAAGKGIFPNVVEVDLGSNTAVHLAWAAMNLPGGPAGATTAASFNVYRGTTPDNMKKIATVVNGTPGSGQSPATPPPTTDFYDTGYLQPDLEDRGFDDGCRPRQ